MRHLQLWTSEASPSEYTSIMDNSTWDYKCHTERIIKLKVERWIELVLLGSSLWTLAHMHIENEPTAKLFHPGDYLWY